MTKDNQRKWHPNFVKYTEFIIKHPNYQGIPYEHQSDGQVKWVVTGKSEVGVLRREWWNKKCKKHGIKIESGCYAEIARAIHPNKKHVCQICGREMNVYYVYPTKRILKILNKIAKTINICESKTSNLDIAAILEKLLNTDNPPYDEVRKLFSIPEEVTNTPSAFIDYIEKHFIDNYSRMFSPGVMSNSPDRLDGFHSDGLCCRSKTDKGRHADNLKRYSQDRRAYENWSEGNWNLANRCNR